MKNNLKVIALYIVLALAVLAACSFLLDSGEVKKLQYSEIVELFTDEKVDSFVVKADNTLEIRTKDNEKISFVLRDLSLFEKDLKALILEQQQEGIITEFHYEEPKIIPWWVSLLPYVIIGIVFIALWFFIMNSAAGGGKGGKMGSFGKSRAKLGVNEKNKVMFTDVAGADEEKEELQEVVEFLKNPDKFTKLGAKIPRGVLLVGPPGTGKTLLAKAVAGEANVPFFSISGSDFVEMYVGVGASRVRDLFDTAKKSRNAIVFIDEIDAVGGSRDNRFGGNTEHDQTLNSLLGEIDGFDSTKGIVVLAATNRPEILDKALLRPGRFDRRIIMDTPNYQGRLDTLKVHTRKIKLAEDVDLKKIAQTTAGCVGADLANLVNEAALRAVRKGRKMVTQEDLLAAYETVMMGSEKKNSVRTETEKRMTAYHEVGHALVAALEKNSMPVSKITIIPRTGGSLGATMYTPEEDKNLYTREDLIARIHSLLGGRAAEEVVFATMTTGASEDLQRATGLARDMIARYGMSQELGLLSPTVVTSQYLDGQSSLDCSQETAAMVDKASQKLLEKCYLEDKQVLTEHRQLLDEISEYLLAKETITGEELMSFVNAYQKKDEAPAEETTEE